MQNQLYHAPPRLRQDGAQHQVQANSSDVGSSNAVNDAFLAFHRRQHGVATPSIGDGTTQRIDAQSSRVEQGPERMANGPPGGSAMIGNDGRNRFGPGIGSTGRSGANVARGGMPPPAFRGRGGRGGFPLPPFQGGRGRGVPPGPPVSNTPQNIPNGNGQRGGHTAERRVPVNRGRGVFPIEGRGNVNRGRGRGAVRPHESSRAIPARYDADFDRGEKPKDTSDAPKQLFNASIGYRPPPSVPAEKLPKKTHTASGSIVAPSSDMKGNHSSDQPTSSSKEHDTHSLASAARTDEARTDEEAVKDDAQRLHAGGRAGLIEVKTSDHNVSQQPKKKGKGRDERTRGAERTVDEQIRRRETAGNDTNESGEGVHLSIQGTLPAPKRASIGDSITARHSPDLVGEHIEAAGNAVPSRAGSHTFSSGTRSRIQSNQQAYPDNFPALEGADEASSMPKPREGHEVLYGWHSTGPVPPPPPWHHGGPSPLAGPPRSAKQRDLSKHTNIWPGLSDAATHHESPGAVNDRRNPGQIGNTSPVPPARQLFDPRREDPMRFALLKGGNARGHPIGPWDNASTPTISSAKAPSGAMSDTFTHAPRKDADRMLEELESVVPGNAAVYERAQTLKAEYRDILALERQLQDEHRNARSASTDKSGMETGNDKDAYPGEERDDAYWVRLAYSHRQLADAYHTFMLHSTDPILPSAMQAIPGKYDMPSRLWRNAFHLLLERLRHALPPALLLVSQAEDGEAAGPVYASQKLMEATTISLLDHLQDFVVYAYIFYSNLLENLPLSAFRSIWMEQSGDVARYRMAIAGLSARLYPTPASSGTKQQEQRSQLSRKDSPRPANRSIAAASAGKRIKQRAGGPQRLDDSELEDADTPAGNSIGAAAIDDWELQEQETWRSVAREWYYRGLEESPGTGRLHHHLALLSKDDDLKALYQFCKSLTASQPFAESRESMLLFFEQHEERTDGTPRRAISAFIRLHKMLFTKVNLDGFEDCLESFLASLEEDSTPMAGKATAGNTKHSQAEENRILGKENTWIMMAVINIAAALDYGAQDSILCGIISMRDHQSEGPEPKSSRSDGIDVGLAKLNLAGNQEAGQAQATEAVSPATYSLKLLFALLKHTIDHSLKPTELGLAISPYITIVLTFLSTIVSSPGALALVEQEIPSASLVHLIESLPHFARSTFLTPPSSRLLGPPLLEDWTVRGMDWTEKRIFGRDFWQRKSASSEINMYAMPESEADVLDDHYEGPSMPSHAGGPASNLLSPQAEGPTDSMEGTLGTASQNVSVREPKDAIIRLRWKRVALTGAWLAKVVPSLSMNATSGLDGAGFTDPAEMSQQSREMAEDSIEQDEQADRETGNAAGEGATRMRNTNSDADKGLETRRKELEALLTASREQALRNKASNSDGPAANRQKMNGRDRKAGQATLPLVPGYTTIVFDTDILLENFELFLVLLESKKWILVVPLAVITELDALKTKTDSIGTSAKQAITYLETSIRAYSSTLKIQTSRGNYLRDLTIRQEDIDFDSLTSSSTTQHSHSKARTMDDVIVYAAKWQEEHWLDRRNLLPPGVLSNEERSGKVGPEVLKTVLVSNDRNLRVKAKARGLNVADAKELERAVKHEDGKREGYPNG